MLIVLLFIGVVLIIAAVRNSHEALFSALGQDVPAFVVWAAAIVAIGAIGFIPDLKPVSRGLLALVVIVLVLRNYSQVLQGFQSAWQNPPPVGQTAASGSSSGSGSGSGGTQTSGLGSLGQYASLYNGFAGAGGGGFGAAADSGSAAGVATDAAAVA